MCVRAHACQNALRMLRTGAMPTWFANFHLPAHAGMANLRGTAQLRGLAPEQWVVRVHLPRAPLRTPAHTWLEASDYGGVCATIEPYGAHPSRAAAHTRTRTRNLQQTACWRPAWPRTRACGAWPPGAETAGAAYIQIPCEVRFPSRGWTESRNEGDTPSYAQRGVAHPRAIAER